MLAFDFHSPVEKLQLPAFEGKNVHVYVKRDDMIHPFISGNKWRKLKYILQHARGTGSNHLVTFGGAWSNHLIATACAGARFGFSTSAFVRGEAVSNPVLSLCRLFGMELMFVSRDAYKSKTALYHTFSTAHAEKTYFIDEGGRDEKATWGCAEVIDELDQPYDHIFCACGTGTTLAGLSLGVQKKQLATKLHGISVLKNGGFLYGDIAKLISDTSNITLHTDYDFGGYAKSDDVLLSFIRKFCAQTGMLIEPVYTGKLFYAVMDLLAKNHFREGDKVLVIHTGGLTGILGMHDQLTPPITPQP